MGCGCTETPCVPISGTSCYGFTASADDLNGTNFTTPANPTQAYQGILLTPFNVTPVFNSPGNWIWWLTDLIDNMNVETVKSTTLSARFPYLTQLTVLTFDINETGSYIANYSAILEDSNGAGFVGYLAIYQNGTLVDSSTVSGFTFPGASGSISSLAGNSPKFTATEGDVITVKGYTSADSEALSSIKFVSGVLTVQQVNP